MSHREPIAHLELQPSEAAVVHAASRIFAAFVTAGRLTERNGADLMRLAVRTAIELARETDQLLDSDEEGGGRPGRLGRLG